MRICGSPGRTRRTRTTRRRPRPRRRPAGGERGIRATGSPAARARDRAGAAPRSRRASAGRSILERAPPGSSRRARSRSNRGPGGPRDSESPGRRSFAGRAWTPASSASSRSAMRGWRGRWRPQSPPRPREESSAGPAAGAPARRLRPEPVASRTPGRLRTLRRTSARSSPAPRRSGGLAPRSDSRSAARFRCSRNRRSALALRAPAGSSQMLRLRFVSSTTVSGHSRDSSSCLGIRCPALRTSRTSVSKTLGLSATRRSPSRMTCSATSRRKGPNS